jgi:hypothetical protein
VKSYPVFSWSRHSPTFYWTRRFITTTKPPHPTSWRCILILSSLLGLCLPSGLFPSGPPPPNKNSTPHICHMSCPSHSSQFDHPNNIWWEVQIISLSSSLCNFLHSPCYLVLFRANILLNTLFSNTHSLWHVLRLRMEEELPIWRVAANILNKQ